jgi:PBP1b-binding outer membrane lipoprotein LpoB
MNTMTTHTRTAPGRALRGASIASLVAVAAVLAGCSSSADAAYQNTMDDAGYAGEPAAPNAGGADTDRSLTEDKSSTGQNALSADRAVIITGSMYMTVEDPIVAADRAAAIVRGAGGRIDARRETAPDEHYGGSAALTLRIPSDRLDGVVEDLRDLGTVDQFTTDSYDVTTQVTDLEAQISTLKASTGRIEALLAQAKDISDIITLENELDRRQAQLESLEARQRGLDDQVSMSTIDLSLTTEPVVVIVEEDEPQTFLGALTSGWDALVGFLSGVLIVLAVLLPWLALIAVIGVPILLVVRARKAREAREAAAALAASAKPTTRRTAAKKA